MIPTINRCCDRVPTGMLGSSWYKNLGFNTACACAAQLYAAGFRYRSDYLDLAALGDTSAAQFQVVERNSWKSDPEWINLWRGE